MREIHRPRHRLVCRVIYLNRITCEDGPVPIFQIGYAIGKGRKGNSVGSQIHFTIAVAHGQGTAFAGANQQIIFSLEQNGKSKSSLQPRQYLPHSFAGRFSPGTFCRQKMGYHFRVGLGLKYSTHGDQFFFEFTKIFNDAIMHNHHVPRRMGVCIRLRGRTMGCPTSVANARHPDHGRFTQALFQIVQLARCPAPLYPAILKCCDTG